VKYHSGYINETTRMDPHWYVVDSAGHVIIIHEGDWIIKDPYSEGYYPLTDEVFKLRWEPIPE
jgi:hypothetical protein